MEDLLLNLSYENYDVCKLTFDYKDKHPQKNATLHASTYPIYYELAVRKTIALELVYDVEKDIIVEFDRNIEQEAKSEQETVSKLDTEKILDEIAELRRMLGTILMRTKYLDDFTISWANVKNPNQSTSNTIAETVEELNAEKQPLDNDSNTYGKYDVVYLNIKEAAQYLDMDESSVYRYTKLGHLSKQIFGVKSYRWHIDELTRFKSTFKYNKKSVTLKKKTSAISLKDTAKRK
jgi:predicted DNA-binding transcriptional regulator AlpA